MTQPDSPSAQNTFNISNSSVTNVTGSGSISYREAAQEAAQEAALSQETDELPKKVILFLAANPLSTRPLRLDEEMREIEAELRRSKHRDRFELKQQWAVRTRDLLRSLLDSQPHIVHFSGHGMGQSTAHVAIEGATEGAAEGTREISFVGSKEAIEEGLILEDSMGQPKLVETEALGALFKLFSESVECVVLNACYSERQAAAIAQHIPYVIGMNQAIGDRAAIEFAVGFYEALGAGQSIEKAYASGCVAIQISGIPEHLTPKLIHTPPEPRANG
ncbi:MAG: CHAT domain-containing protein [Cyanobacteria bacterium J06623_4]